MGIRYLSKFSGIGGFELGIQRAYRAAQAKRQIQGTADSDMSGHDEKLMASEPLCVGFSEIDKYAKSIYQKHFKEHRDYGCARSINEKELPDFDMLVGGFPCQAFSVAGRRGGFSDTRGTLFFEIARIAREKQPRILLLENVKGLLSHNKGYTFATILNALDEIGYDAEWQVLNSTDFGIPHNRERTYIVGHLRGTGTRQVFPLRRADAAVIGEHKEATRLIPATVDKVDKQGSVYLHKFNKVNANCLCARDAKGLCRSYNVILESPDIIKTATAGNSRPQRVNTIDRSSVTIAATIGGGGAGTGLYAIPALDKDAYDGCRIRRLTPTECERLQGFPDGWTAEGVTGAISDTQRYKCLGNAVTTNVVEAVASELLECLA